MKRAKSHQAKSHQGPGHPPLPGKVRRMVILTEALDAKARRMGKGKLSPGVRECIERAKEG